MPQDFPRSTRRRPPSWPPGRDARMLAWRRRIGLKHAAIAFSASLVLAFAGILLQASLHARRQILADAAARAGSMVRYAQSSSARSLLWIDAMLAGISQSLATVYRDVPVGGLEVGALLRRMNEHILPVRDILLIDENGREVNGGAAEGGGRR